jgi:uncharacterized protein
MKSKSPLVIYGTEVPPGSEVLINLPVASYYGHSDITMPVQVLSGKQQGPTLLVNAAIHGDEVNGVEIIRRLLLEPALLHLKGDLLLVPIVNIYGFLTRSRYLPDRRDLNRSFPGSEKGSLAARVAELFLREIAVKATHAIDLHTGAIHRSNLPQVRISFQQEGAEGFARSFNAPVILDANYRDGSLRDILTEYGIPCLVYEGGEALRFDEMAIQTGVKGILSTMRYLGMLPADLNEKRSSEPLVTHSSYWVRAPESGILRSQVPLGARVEKDELLGVIDGPFGHTQVPIVSPFAGMVIGKTLLPPTHEGEALFHIAKIPLDSAVEKNLTPAPLVPENSRTEPPAPPSEVNFEGSNQSYDSELVPSPTPHPLTPEISS